MSHKKNLLTNEEIAFFCEQMHIIVKSELPLYYGISLLRDEATDTYTKELLTRIYEPMEKGISFYNALSETGAFPRYMLEMIHVGEQTGRLDEVLKSLIVYYEREAEIQSGIKHAVTYPLIMSIMMFTVVVVIITKVVPIFSQVYAELGSTLTGSAKLLMNISNFLNKYLLSFMIGFVLLLLIIFIFFKTAIGKRFYERRKIVRSLAASRIANCLYLALASGLDTDEGLSLSETLVGNSHMEECIRRCKDYMKNGETFAKSLIDSNIFSKMYASLITIGYKTSSMDDVMLRLSKAYEQDTDERIRHFISILEPTLIIILSFFIGLILFSFLLPLLGIMSSIG
ncbi:MAG: type II secretion system F family protein [Lachnospiraceae bacterium]|nr:type II secretion system F family protein [Lachnospiraceae bacterium]MBQ5675557.1 type II secretion system F family protein [Lachnospiraceae bacterium]